MKILCIDFDDVIFKTKPIVEKLLEEIEPMATERALKESLAKLKNSGNNESKDEMLRRQISNEHFDYKDRVLEEIDDKYKNRIDYEAIFSSLNVFPGTLQYVNYLQKCGRYDKVYILTHCNVEREVNAKLKFINKHFPGVEMIAVPFHRDKYVEGMKRPITSKADFFMEYTGLTDLSNCTLIDDSVRNGNDWEDKSGNYIRFNPTGEVTMFGKEMDGKIKRIYRKEITSLLPSNIIVMSNSPLGKRRK